MEKKCYGSKKIVPLKFKAQWVGDIKKVARQLMVSLKSYLIYPFTKKDIDATREYFMAVYSASIVDDLIFDGNDHAYFNKVSALLKGRKEYNCIYDCGCGYGAFLEFAIKAEIKFDEYVGIDFAINGSKEEKGVKYIKDDVVNYYYNDQFKTRLVVLCNIVCYLSDEKLGELLKKLAFDGTTLLVVDPIPGLFWDATFSHVKLYYRNPQIITELMQKYGYTHDSYSIDYLIKLGDAYMFPLSYASIYNFKPPYEKG